MEKLNETLVVPGELLHAFIVTKSGTGVVFFSLFYSSYKRVVNKRMTRSLSTTQMDYFKMDQLFKILFPMSTVERTEFIVYLHCINVVYVRQHGHMKLNEGLAPGLLHLPEVIEHHNNFYQKITFLKWFLDLNTVDQCCLKFVFRFK